MPHKKLLYLLLFAITFFVLLSFQVNSTTQLKLKENKSTDVIKNNPKNLTPSSSPLYDTGGYTFYDLQALEKLQREIAIDSFGNVHVVWMKGLDSTSSQAGGPREIYYSSWSADGSRLAHEVQVSETGARGGFPSIAVLPDGRTVCVYHHANTLLGGRTDGLYASIEQTPDLGNFTGEIHLPDSVAGMGDAAMWPACAAQKVDDSVIIHVVGIEGPYASGNIDFIYTRGVESPQDTFTFSPVQRPDSSNFMSMTIIASIKSNRVAIIYSRQKSFGGLEADADIFYIESNEGGRDWVNGFGNDVGDTVVNVTKYQPSDPIRASGDLSAVYDEDDSLHIVWIAPLYSAGSTASECFIYHWSKLTGIDQVADGTFNIPDANLPTSVSNTNLRNPHIGVHDGTGSIYRKNYLYVIWSQFGPVTSDHSVDGFLNGEIYVNASTTGGQTWGNPINITNSQTPGCDRNCDSDVYPSLAERVNDTLHILYVNDKSAGTMIYGEGDPVSNPVVYFKYPAFRAPCDFFSLAVVPPIFEDVVLTPGGVFDSSLKIFVSCLEQDTRVDSIRTEGSSWLQILTSPDSFTLKPGDPPETVDIRFDATALSPSTYIDTIVVYSQAPPFRSTVPVRLVVTDCGYFRRSQVVATVGDLKVKFSNTSNLADQDSDNGFYLTSINKNFLYDGSTVLTTITADGDTIAAQDILYHQSFKPLSSIDTQTVNLTDSLIYFAQAVQQQRPVRTGNWFKVGPIYKAMFFPDLKSPDIPWPGHWFKYQIKETWWIRVATKPRYVLWFTKIFKADPPCWWPLWPGDLLVNKIYAGSVLDWDVPSDTGVALNNWGNNDTLKFVWLQGDGPNSNKFFAATMAIVDTGVHIGNPNGFWSAKVHRNAEFYYLDDPRIIYRVISDSGFNPKDTLVDPLAFTPVDRHIQFGSVRFDTTADTVNYAQALVVSDIGYDSLKHSIFRARLDMGTEFLGCDGGFRAGDVNGNGNLNLTDIVMLVNYIFKGGTEPYPACTGDVNYDGKITLPDIVFLVNYIFKGGPRPPKHLYDICCQ